MGNWDSVKRIELKSSDWAVRVKVWQSLAKNRQNISATIRELQPHAGEEGYPENVPDKETIKKIRNELSTLSPELISTLPPEVQAYARELNPQLKEKLELLKNNSPQAQGKEFEQGRMITEAKRKHFEELCEVIKEWREELGFKVDPPMSWFEVVFPTEFEAKHAIRGGRYRKGSLCWKVDRDGSVEVWFPVEDSPLFRYLKPHIPNEELWRDFEKLKQILTDGIKQAASIGEGRNISVKGATGLAAEIFDGLELALARPVFSGKCPACAD